MSKNWTFLLPYPFIKNHMTSRLLDALKTPLPASAELLNYSEGAHAGCTLAEVIPFGCTCGVDFTIYGYSISQDFLVNKLSVDQIAKKYKLNGCCRMRLLSPFTTNIVSMDINAKVNDMAFGEILLENLPAPKSQIFNPESFFPPSVNVTIRR
jgi:hypothetical protein